MKHAAQRSFEWCEGWGMAFGNYARVLRPRSIDELRACLQWAQSEQVPLALRGGGCSYGDANTTARGAVLDLARWNERLDFDPSTGIADVDPGVTVRQLWQAILPHGHWPRVVSGTMYPTMAGAAAMNIHGKNAWKVGPLGDSILEFDLLSMRGELVMCSRDSHPELFHAAIGGAGLLGVMTRVRLKTKPVSSGELWVRAKRTQSLAETMQWMESRLSAADYLVAWLDCFAQGEASGRGVIHEARHLQAGEDAAPARTLSVAHQELPARIAGLFPKSEVWRILRWINHAPGMRALNATKHLLGEVEERQGWYRQSHAAFAFLLDYVPNWKWAYGRHERHGLVQHQLFVPHAKALEVFLAVLERDRRAGHASFLGVLKRHRADAFRLTHGVDGWSLALDYKVEPQSRNALLAHLDGNTRLVLEAGGRLYLAKDAVIGMHDARRMWGDATLADFGALKRSQDPHGLLQSDQHRRVFGPAWEALA
jgi:FAD/FMN-containing dehydrogenase